MSRYMVEKITNGFVVREAPAPLARAGQPDWQVEMRDEYMYGRTPVSVVRKPAWLETEPGGARFCFCDYYGLLKEAASVLLSSWEPPDWREEGWEEVPAFVPDWLRDWAIKRTSWAINKLVYPHWQQLLSEVDPTVLAVHKAVFSATFGYDPGGIILQEELYREQYLVRDILKYRAAAVAARLCQDVGGSEPALEKMANWRSLYCPEGVEPNGILNKTLDNLPGGVPIRLLRRLRKFELPRIITNRLELIATLLASETDRYCNLMPRGGDGVETHPDGRKTYLNFTAIALSEAAQIVKAMEKVSGHIHEKYKPRRLEDVGSVLGFLLRYPKKHKGRIVGLADKAIKRDRDSLQAYLKKLGENHPLARPPIPLPTQDGIRFLETVGDVCREAEQMDSCIAKYAPGAVYGGCYLFHVTHQGEEASVEVNPCGSVVQSRGPGNSKNQAAAWGKRVLSRWAKPWRDPPRREPC
jgi:hypothetical protein